VKYSPEHNPCDALLRRLTGAQEPSRNDCGYPGRWECEDTSRMFGWGVEGAGTCDYPNLCAWHREGRCPLKG
jgi:hypothetical protein